MLLRNLFVRCSWVPADAAQFHSAFASFRSGAHAAVSVATTSGCSVWSQSSLAPSQVPAASGWSGQRYNSSSAATLFGNDARLMVVPLPKLSHQMTGELSKSSRPICHDKQSCSFHEFCRWASFLDSLAALFLLCMHYSLHGWLPQVTPHAVFLSTCDQYL